MELAGGLQPRALDPAWQATVVTIAGDGLAAARDGDVRDARFADPFGVAIAPDGAIYVADAGDSPRIRRISLDGTVFTVAGGERGFADGVGGAARFNAPSGLAIDAGGTLFVADTGNNAIRRMTPDGTVSTIAGDGSHGYRDGPGAQAQFNGPIGVAVDVLRPRAGCGHLQRSHPRHQSGRDGVTTLAGSAVTGLADGAAANAQFNTPCGVAVDRAGALLVADTGNRVIRLIFRPASSPQR